MRVGQMLQVCSPACAYSSSDTEKDPWSIGMLHTGDTVIVIGFYANQARVLSDRLGAVWVFKSDLDEKIR